MPEAKNKKEYITNLETGDLIIIRKPRNEVLCWLILKAYCHCNVRKHSSLNNLCSAHCPGKIRAVLACGRQKEPPNLFCPAVPKSPEVTFEVCKAIQAEERTSAND